MPRNWIIFNILGWGVIFIMALEASSIMALNINAGKKDWWNTSNVIHLKDSIERVYIPIIEYLPANHFKQDSLEKELKKSITKSDSLTKINNKIVKSVFRKNKFTHIYVNENNEAIMYISDSIVTDINLFKKDSTSIIWKVTYKSSNPLIKLVTDSQLITKQRQKLTIQAR